MPAPLIRNVHPPGAPPGALPAQHGHLVLALPAVSLPASSMIIQYHRAPDRGPRHYCETVAAGRCRLTVALRHGRTRVHRNGELLHDGPVFPGMTRMAEAGDCIEGEAFSALEAVSIDLPADRLAGWRPAACAQLRPMLQADPRTEQLGRMLVDFSQREGRQAALFGQGVVDALLAVVLDHDEAMPPSGRRGAEFDRAMLQRVLDAADAHGSGPLGLTGWASAVGVPLGEFARRFRRTTGSSPYAYLLRRRVERAKDLMLGTELSLIDIALETGFCSQSHFTGAFRRMTGVSPGKWRRAVASDRIEAAMGDRLLGGQP